MKALILFNVDFAAWPLAIRNSLAERLNDFETAGVVVLDHTIRALVEHQSGGQIAPLIDLTELEPKWISDDAGSVTLAKYEQILGHEAVARIAIADRELSQSLICGATMPRSPLSELARSPLHLRAYQGGMLTFFDRLFEQQKFEFVLSFTPQDAPSVAAGLLARHHSVPFFHVRPVGFQGLSCLCDDIAGMMPVFRDDVARNDHCDDPLAPYLVEAQRVLTEFRARPTPPSYLSVANASVFQRPDLTTFAALLYRGMTGRPPEALRYPYPLSRLYWEAARWLRASRDMQSSWFKAAPAPKRPFAYFPLHYEPEASTLVAAPHAINQIAIIESLAEATPPDWTIVVKEHMPMMGRRPGDFYRRLRAIPKVSLLSPRADSFALIESAELTITITGTAGLEAVLLGRPVLFLGPSPIQIVKRGFVVCENIAELGSAIEKALKTPALDDDLAHRFVAALIKHGVDVPADLVWGGPSVVTCERVAVHRNVSDRITDLILAALASAA
jgi:hypothetical protein